MHNSNIAPSANIAVFGEGKSGREIIDNLKRNFSHSDGRFALYDTIDPETFIHVVESAGMIILMLELGGKTELDDALYIVESAKSGGVFTVAVVTMPFRFEGKKSLDIAQKELAQLKNNFDTIITIRNDELLSIMDPKMKIPEAYHFVNVVVSQTIQGIIGMITPSDDNDITVDMDDVQSILRHGRSALTGIGESQDVNAAYDAMRQAILQIDNYSTAISDATGFIVHFTMHPELPYTILAEALDVLHLRSNPTADIIFATTTDRNLSLAFVRVMLIPTGFDKKALPPVNNIW